MVKYLVEKLNADVNDARERDEIEDTEFLSK
jgi:hypothetical protein